MKRVLAIGGSDSGGGAGIQADLKTLHALGVHGSTVITAVTAQSTTAVTDVHDVPVSSITAQLTAVLDDIGADVVKTGMLSSAGAVQAVHEALGDQPLIIDPVGISSTGRSLLAPAALDLLRALLLPRALIVTPNLTEVAALTGVVVSEPDQLLDAAKAVHALGVTWVLVTGGHLRGRPVDLLYDGEDGLLLPGERVHTANDHGTGCTLATALAGYLALGDDVPTAAGKAKAFVTEALRNSYPLGAGAGPVRP